MVSVIIPAFNVEKFLPRAINSVLDSTVNDFELIIVDDGSTDSTGLIADGFSRCDSRIRVIHTPNQGAARARMNGVVEASNDFVTFVDADDTMEPNAIEWLRRYVDDEVSVVVGGIRRVTPGGSYAVNAPLEGVVSARDFIESLLAGVLIPTVCGKLFRRRDLLDINTSLDAEIKLNEDFLMLIGVMQYASTVYVHTKNPIYNYNYREGSATDSGAMSYQGWTKLINSMRPYVDDSEAFFRYRLRRIYDCCITRGVRLSYLNPEVKRLVVDSRKYLLSPHERRIVWMLRSRLLRAWVARRHSHAKPPSQIIISVIMASYNQPRLMERAIRSVISQTFHDWELIVVDDCSTDNTRDVVRSIAAIDNRVRLLKTSSNAGQGAARLQGISASRGEFVAFLDQDDVFAPEALSKMWHCGHFSDSDIVVMGSCRMSRSGALKIPLFSPDSYFSKPYYSSMELLPALLLRNGFPCTQWDKLYRRSFIGDLSQYDVVSAGEDLAFNFELFVKGGKIGWVDYVGYKWRTGGQSSVAYPQRWEHDLDVYRNMLGLMKKHGLDGDAKLRLSLDQGLVNDLLDKVACALRQQWRGGLSTFVTMALSSGELLSAMNNVGMKVSSSNLLVEGKEWRSRHRMFYWAMRLINLF